jgi:hypothetical protein
VAKLVLTPLFDCLIFKSAGSEIWNIELQPIIQNYYFLYRSDLLCIESLARQSKSETQLAFTFFTPRLAENSKS